MPGGRPTDYTEELVSKAKEYLIALPEEEVIHSIEGLAEYIGVTRPTIYDWESQEEKAEFSYIVEQVRQKQAKALVNKGLTGVFSSPITKVMLSKHGYREGIENMGENGGPMKIDLSNVLDKAYGTDSPGEVHQNS